MNQMKDLGEELKNTFDLEGYTLLEVIKGYENIIYCLLKGNKRFYLKQMGNSVSYETETQLLKKLNEGDYLIPHIEESFSNKQANIITEVKGDISRILTPLQANRLGNSLRSLHLESSKINNFEGNSSFLELYALFRNNVLIEAREKRFLSSHQISICLKLLDILDNFIDEHYKNSEKTTIHGDLNSGNIIFGEKVGFIDFEKARIGNILEDISRLYSRTFNNNDILIDNFLNGYLNGKLNKKEFSHQMVYFELFNYLGDISYFLYKGHSNGYIFHGNALESIARILQTKRIG